MNASVTNRRAGANKQPKSPSTLGEKLISWILVAVSVAIGLTVVVTVVQNVKPLPASTEPALLQQNKLQDSSSSTGAVKATDTAAASTGFVKPAVVSAGAANTKVASTEAANRGAANSSEVSRRDADRAAVSTFRVFSEPSPQEVARLQRAAKVLDPELMEQMPEAFDGNVKNPCWTSSSGELRCLPYVYVTGMFHAGALSLADKLRVHPDIVTDACTGCQFWGEEGKTMAFYLDHMREAARAIKEAPATKVLMDSSPSTFAFYWAGGGKAHRGFAEAMKPCYGSCVDSFNKDKVPIDTCMDLNCYKASLAGDEKRAQAAGLDYDKESHNPVLVRAAYGNRPPKMILIARDPVMRLYSAFHGYPHYHGKYGKDSAGFTAYVKEQVGSFRACAQSHGDRRCALLFEALGAREEKVYFHADQLMRGMYGLFLEIWYRFIQPSNWLVIHSDDFFQQPKPTMARVVDFLGLTKVNGSMLEAMAAAGKVNTYTTDQQPIEPEARRLLIELYKPYNTQLARLTGDARYEKWNQQ